MTAQDEYFRLRQQQTGQRPLRPKSVGEAVQDTRSGKNIDPYTKTTASAIGTAIPVVGAFKAVGETVAGLIRQDDQYGVAQSDWQAGAGAVFNPINQTTDMISDIGKGDFKSALGNALIIGGAMETNRKQREARRLQQSRIRYYNQMANEQAGLSGVYP